MRRANVGRAGTLGVLAVALVLLGRERHARLAADALAGRLRRLEGIARLGLAAETIEGLLGDLLPLLQTLLGADRVEVEIDDGPRADTGEPGPSGSCEEAELAGRDRRLGALRISARRPGAFDAAARELLSLAADRIALAVERVQLFEHEHAIALNLQRSVLPEKLPSLDGVELAAAYLPGATGTEVGGDWYDAFELPDGQIVLAIGDVIGKGVVAAASMAQLRNSLRVYALDGMRPAAVLERLNWLCTTAGPTFATAVVVTADPRSGRCRYATAGHLPPLLRRADGSTELLERARSLPLGVADRLDGRNDAVALGPGDALLLYTDGLVERRDQPLDRGLDLLRDAATRAAGPDGATARRIVDDAVATLVPAGGAGDDVAVLALLRTPEPVAAYLDLELRADPSALAELRAQLRRWLADHDVDGTTAQEIVLAGSEACANAVEHPVGRGDHVVRFRAWNEHGVLVFSVRDTGRWKAEVESPYRGFGMRLIHQVMDEVAVERTDAGTEVLMRRAVRR